MLVLLLQIMLTFFMSQSVSWLTSLLKLDKYRHISGPEWDIFLKKIWDIPGMLLHHFQIILISCMYLSLLVGLLPYWNHTKVGLSPVLYEISFWNFLEAFLGCFYTCSKWFWISCMSVNLLVGLLPYWNYTNIGISPYLEDITFSNFLETFLGCLYTFYK